VKRKTAYLIINPRLGKKVDALTAMIAALAAAGWKTDTAIKEFGGHTRRLARKAAEAGYDLVIGFGGDGTLNQVVNGVMAAGRRGCIVGVIPGGTANVWAHEIGMSEDPVKASLLLINSEGCKVDVGRVAVDSLPVAPGKRDGHNEERQARPGRHHFLLMAGLGADAAIMSQVPTSLKERIGKAAVVLAALETLPSQHAFPIEIWSSDEGSKEVMRWRGRALQVIIGNTRRYGNFAEATPDALIDDGALDVCIVTAGATLSTIEQILSILLHRNLRNGRCERFRGSHFWIRAPASIDLQLDGSRVKLDDGVRAPDVAERRQGKNPEAMMMTYRFDAIPRALHVAIPCTYNGALFENGSAKEIARPAEKQSPAQDAVRAQPRKSKDVQYQHSQRLDALLEHGRKVTVVGVAPNPERKTTYIVAGVISGKKAGVSEPVAVRIDHNTTLVGPTGQPLPISLAAKLLENTVIVVEGKQSKRGVVRAKRVVVVN
jgi:YegS/Rv2252/BmrU family lipid kinase